MKSKTIKVIIVNLLCKLNLFIFFNKIPNNYMELFFSKPNLMNYNIAELTVVNIMTECLTCKKIPLL